MRILTIGDPHFRVKNERETELMTSEILVITQKINPDLIVVLGDVLDQFEKITVGPFIRATKFLNDLSKITTLFILIGNHDRPNNEEYLTERHPFNPLKFWEKTIIVDNVLSAECGDLKLVFVPYVSKGRFKEALDYAQVKINETDLFFAHQEFRGGFLSIQNRSTDGDSWPETNPPVISGHLHEFHHLGTNIYYPGSPIQQNFGETENKSISLFELEKGSLTEERIFLESTLIKKTIVLPVSELYHFVLPEEKRYLYRIIAKGNSSEIGVAIKDLRRRFPKDKVLSINYEIKEENQKPTMSPPKKFQFLDLLRENSSRFSRKKKIFEELFGSS